jgi:ABC-type multidrug transport system fused ATPase/permease subunit
MPPTSIGVSEGALLLTRLLRPYWARVALGFSLLVFGITLEAVALISLGALLNLLAAPDGLAEAPEGIFSILEWAFDGLNVDFTATTVILGIAALFLVKGATGIAADISFLSVRTDMERDTRSRLAEGLLFAEWNYVQGQRLGDLVNVLIGQIATTAMTARQAMNLLSMVGTVTVYITFAMLVSPLATLMLAGTVGVTGAITWYVFRAMSSLGSRSIGVIGTLNHQVNEMISGFVVLKSMGVESGAVNRLRRHTQELKHVTMKIGILRAGLNSAMEPGIVTALITVVILEAITSFDYAALSVVGLLLFRTFQRVYAVTVSVGMLGEGVASVAAVERLSGELQVNREQSSGLVLAEFESVELRGLSVSYGESNAALRDINFQISKGEFVGIVGQSGAGKSTLAGVIMGLVNPSQGTVLVNGSDINEIDRRSWREQIGFVPQETFLFNDSVEENIKVWRPSIDEDSLKRASRISQSTEFIANLPDGMASPLGDRGIGLSGGERQRLALARAIVSDPRLLLLDEATSSLDTESERAFQDALSEIKGDVTILAIAHRLSTVVDADRIVVLEKGAMVEEGSPTDLLRNKNGRFSELYRLQSAAPLEDSSTGPTE